MHAIKTSISFEPELFRYTDQVAHELNLSRSKLVALALESFFVQMENKRLFEKINAAHADGPDPAEHALLNQIRQQQRPRVEFQCLQGGATGQALIDAMQSSPYRDRELEPKRWSMLARDVEGNCSMVAVRWKSLRACPFY